MTRNWFRTLFARPIVRKSPKSRTRPALEILEDRTVPTTFTVANGLDSGAGSLRAAIALADANPGADTINFAAGVNSVTLTSGELLLSTDVTIAGPASGTVTVARSAAVGTPQFRIFETAANATVQMSHLTITGGVTAGDGGGILDHGVLMLTSSTVSGNSASHGGGGIAARLAATITSCIISGNSADIGGGGGIEFEGINLYVRSSIISVNKALSSEGGGISLSATGELVVESSTLSGNSAGSNGGGIDIKSSSRATVTSSTLSGNSAATFFGGGIQVDFSGGGADRDAKHAVRQFG